MCTYPIIKWVFASVVGVEHGITKTKKIQRILVIFQTHSKPTLLIGPWLPAEAIQQWHCPGVVHRAPDQSQETERRPPVCLQDTSPGLGCPVLPLETLRFSRPPWPNQSPSRTEPPPTHNKSAILTQFISHLKLPLANLNWLALTYQPWLFWPCINNTYQSISILIKASHVRPRASIDIDFNHVSRDKRLPNQFRRNAWEEYDSTSHSVVPVRIRFDQR